MTLQNRVDPLGRLHATPARGNLMGNRGILHDDQQNVLKTHAHRNWVACALAFKGRRRQVMAPRRYTELFFLDEVTALSAGHRPCASCRRDRYLAFIRAWEAVHGGTRDGLSLPQTMDRMLHGARTDRRRERITLEAEAADLPDGTIFTEGTEAFLIWAGQSFLWSFGGYTPVGHVPHGRVTVVTPGPILAVLSQGYRPQTDTSLGTDV